MIDRITIDKIMDAAQIVDVVSDFVTLKRAGANYKGLCPFHDDRTPSFMVSPSKNYCKCFACGKGGNPVTFLMEHEQISYPDALRWLAKKYGITIKEKELSAEEKAAQTDRDSMFVVNDWARQWFSHQLYDTEDGRAIGLAYFRNRGFRDDIIKKFQLGFCPNRRDVSMTNDAIKAGYQERYLTCDPDTGIGTGLSFKSQKDGSLRDRFFGRVMWPIFTIGGKVAGFGGRVLDAATKGVAIKYQNSPESIIYSKKRELFGLFHAKQAIVKHDLCYMVEGYTDVMAMHQNGVENVVSSSGTALTDDQIRLLHRFTSNITVIYDGDAAGIKASQRGIDMLLAQGLNVRLLLLPDGDDPDSFARKHTAEEFQKYLADNQVDFIKFKTDLVLKEAQGDPIKLSRLVTNIVASIAVIKDPISRTFYIREIAGMMNMSEQIISDAVSRQLATNNEEERKRALRESNRAQGAPPMPAEPPIPEEIDDIAAAAGAQPTPQAYTADGLSVYERLLTQVVVRHGEAIICNGDDGEGNEVPISMAEFIALSLNQDNLQLQDQRYQAILNEAQQYVHNEGWTAERHFINHPDPQISTLAIELASERETLSKVHGPEENQNSATQLLDLAVHVLTDFKLSIVKKEKKELERRINDPAILRDKAGYMEVLKRFKEIKEIEMELAKQCGDRVIMR